MGKDAWWKNKVAYQIYPRSFRDSNGDGIGDLNGITEKLDYLQSLGVDLVWLSPVYRSPMDDGGYDISDYEDINPMFGSMKDMDRLIAEAKKRGIRLLMDLVVNHCSDEHPWFQKALREPNSEEAGYFWFVRSGDAPPNNWASMFGGSAWEPVGDGRWYMHLFSKKQPDLNWENPKLRRKIYEMIRFWLDKGLGGFRIDAITHIKKMPGLPSGPAERPGGLVGCHAYTRCIDGIGEFLTELRKETFDRYECITVAEAAGVPPHQLKDYVGEDGYFSTMFDFSYAEPYNYGRGWHTAKGPGEWDFRAWRDSIYLSQTETQKIGRGAVFLENHDYPRACQKFVPAKDHSPAVQKMLGQLFFYLYGIPFIYQGQELGLDNPHFQSIDQMDDISTKNHYRIAMEDGLSPEEALPLICRYSRDNARTPFPWDNTEYGGFCASGTKPWLWAEPADPKANVLQESSEPDSVLNFYKEMIAIRKSETYGPTVVDGFFKPILKRYDKLIAYTRTGDRNLAVVCSLSDRSRFVRLPFLPKKVIQRSCAGESFRGQTLKLLPYQSLLMEF